MKREFVMKAVSVGRVFSARPNGLGGSGNVTATVVAFADHREKVLLCHLFPN